MGFTRPTPIQSDAIPPAMQGKDLLACASTGSGKTAAFLLPILDKLISKPRRTTRALVLTPTRELAAQIVEQMDAMSVHTPVTAAAIIGGVGMGPQEHAFRTGTDVLVATPGRLLDHMKAPYAKLDRIEYLVLDEADRMLDMGFIEDIETIVAATPATRQTMLFSATLDGKIGSLTGRLLKDPERIEIVQRLEQRTNIAQTVHYVDDRDHKDRLLDHLLRDEGLDQAIVFTATKMDADQLAGRLADAGFESAALHGDLPQGARNRTIKALRERRVRVLVATDVAARGIDIPGITHVFNYDLPKFAEDYVHRIGRTGRAGRSGIAVSLVHHAEQGALKRIERFVRTPLPVNVVEGFEPRKSAPSGNGRPGFGGRGRPGGGNSGGRRFGSGSGKPAGSAGSSRSGSGNGSGWAGEPP